MSLRFRSMLARAILVLGLAFAAIVPAQAAVTITFWSQEYGRNFPHAFFTLDGTPDAGGEPVHLTYGFTAKAITPAILLGTVAGRIDIATPDYIDRSNAHFSLEISDAQYAAIRSLVEEWGEEGDHRYNLNRRNCVHFVAEAARRAGLTVVEDRRLMKKPRSFTQSVARANAGEVRVIELPAAGYREMLAADAATVPVASDPTQGTTSAVTSAPALP